MTVNESLQDRIIRTLVGLTATALAVIVAIAVPVLSPTGIVNLFFLVLGICGFTMYRVWRDQHTYA